MTYKNIDNIIGNIIKTEPSILNTPNTLVIDDDPIFRRLAEINLERLGLRVYGIDDPDEVKSKMKIMKEIDLLLMDTEMGRKKGYNYCEELRATYRVPVIGMSINKEYEKEWKKVKANGFINKSDISKQDKIYGILSAAVIEYHFKN